MHLNDLILDVRAELDDVRSVDILVSLNRFIRAHRVLKEILFKLIKAPDSEESFESNESVGAVEGLLLVTPAIDEDHLVVTRYDHESGVVSYRCELHKKSDKRGFYFTLPSGVVMLLHLSHQGYPLFLGKDYNIRGSRVVELYIELDFSADIELSSRGWIVYPALSLDSMETLDLPFPDHYYGSIRSYVMWQLYKNKRYRDLELALYYMRDYNAERVKHRNPSGVWRPDIVRL